MRSDCSLGDLSKVRLASCAISPYGVTMKRMATLIVGWLCLGLGVMGLFLPFLQGLVLIGCGLLILSKESETMKRLGDRFKERYPEQYERLLRWRNRLISRLKK